jgi:DNA polymerase-3 subunit alpha
MMMVMELPYEKAIRYGEISRKWESLLKFIWDASDVQIAEPIVPPCEDWSTMEKLAKKKRLLGFTSRDIR